MGKQTVEQQIADETKQAVGIVFEKISCGEAPDDLVNLYQSMTQEQFGYWLHGFYCGISQKLKLWSSEIYEFLTESLKKVQT